MDKAVDVPNRNIANTSSLVSTQEIGRNIYRDYFTSIKNHSIFNRYTRTYDHIGLTPESPMYITRTREYFSVSRPKKYKEI